MYKCCSVDIENLQALKMTAIEFYSHYIDAGRRSRTVLDSVQNGVRYISITKQLKAVMS